MYHYAVRLSWGGKWEVYCRENDKVVAYRNTFEGAINESERKNNAEQAFREELERDNAKRD